MLCQLCQSIFNCDRSQRGKLLERGFHVVSFRGIKLSGRAGCALCAQLFRKLKNGFPEQDIDQAFWSSKHRLYFQLDEHRDHPDRFTLSFRLAASSNSVDAASESSNGDVAETLNQFHVASYNSKSLLS
jgi:hypothetical protein